MKVVSFRLSCFPPSSRLYKTGISCLKIGLENPAEVEITTKTLFFFVVFFFFLFTYLTVFIDDASFDHARYTRTSVM